MVSLLSYDTQNLILSAMGTPEAANQVINAINIGSTTAPELANGNSGSTKTLTFSLGTQAQSVSLNANCTFTLAGMQSGGAYELRVVQSGGSHTASFTGVKWPGGTAPVITTTNGAVDIISFYCDANGVIYGTFAQAFA